MSRRACASRSGHARDGGDAAASGRSGGRLASSESPLRGVTRAPSWSESLRPQRANTRREFQNFSVTMLRPPARRLIRNENFLPCGGARRSPVSLRLFARGEEAEL